MGASKPSTVEASSTPAPDNGAESNGNRTNGVFGNAVPLALCDGIAAAICDTGHFDEGSGNSLPAFYTFAE